MFPIITKLGGRRFILAIVGMMLVSLLLVGGYIKNEDVFGWLLMGFVTVYTGGNVTQKVSNIKAGITE